MPRPSLATGRKTATTKRKTAADKIAEKSSTLPLASINTQQNDAVSQVPGLTVFSPDAIAGMMPQFSENSYAVTDPLNPPAAIAQATETQFNQGMGIYVGADRALQLTGAAFDLTKQRFTTVGKQAKAFGAGIKAATEFEKVKADYFDYQGQLQTNQQKAVTLDVSQHRTAAITAQALYDKSSLDEKLNQSKIDAELNAAKSRSKQSILDEFLKQLGEIT